MRVRLVGVLLVSLLVAGASAEQGRPIFTGMWKFVGEKSTPPDKAALGHEFRITQEANALVLEVPTQQFVRQPDGKSELVDRGLGSPMAYKMDGDEHSLPLFPRSADGEFIFSAIPGGLYRVSWDGSILVIAGSDEIPYTSVRDGRTLVELVRRRVSTSFLLNPDGTLLVERTIERAPDYKGQIGIPNTSFKSLYRKTS